MRTKFAGCCLHHQVERRLGRRLDDQNRTCTLKSALCLAFKGSAAYDLSLLQVHSSTSSEIKEQQN